MVEANRNGRVTIAIGFEPSWWRPVRNLESRGVQE
jgi:hypothetical protein